MHKVITLTATYLAYSVPVTRQATIYADCEPNNGGCTFEVSTHSGNVGVMWEFKPFKTLEEAQVYALRFLAPSRIHKDL